VHHFSLGRHWILHARPACEWGCLVLLRRVPLAGLEVPARGHGEHRGAALRLCAVVLFVGVIVVIVLGGVGGEPGPQ
jgi:hypothetical protein